MADGSKSLKPQEYAFQGWLPRFATYMLLLEALHAVKCNAVPATSNWSKDSNRATRQAHDAVHEICLKVCSCSACQYEGGKAAELAAGYVCAV